MNKNAIRSFHKYFALVLSPFIIVIAIIGAMLLTHEHGLINYSKDFITTLLYLHTWSYLNIFIALIVPLALIVLASSGILLFVSTFKK